MIEKDTKINQLNTDLSNKIGFIDTSNVIYSRTINTTGGVLFTASEDMYVFGTLSCNTTLTPILYLNGLNRIIAYGTNVADALAPFAVYLKKGQVLKARASTKTDIFTTQYIAYGLL